MAGTLGLALNQILYDRGFTVIPQRDGRRNGVQECSFRVLHGG